MAAGSAMMSDEHFRLHLFFFFLASDVLCALLLVAIMKRIVLEPPEGILARVRKSDNLLGIIRVNVSTSLLF